MTETCDFCGTGKADLPEGQQRLVASTSGIRICPLCIQACRSQLGRMQEGQIAVYRPMTVLPMSAYAKLLG